MTPSPPDEHVGNSDEDPVEALVFEVLERMEREGSAAIERAASDHPELERAFRTRIEALQQMGLVELPLDVPIDLPKRMGPFELGQPIGVGGMGLVFEAHDASINRQVAIKVIRPQYLTRDSLRERFRREGQAIARLKHSSVARVFQVGEVGGLPYLAMERVFGCTLAEALDEVHREAVSAPSDSLSGSDFFRVVRRLSKGPSHDWSPRSTRELNEPAFRSAAGESHGKGVPEKLGEEAAKQSAAVPAKEATEAHEPEPRNHPVPDLFAGTWAQAAVKICREIAEGLAHAHAAGVLHRDVKASNIMVTPEGRVLLIDFGLAQLDTAATMTLKGGRLGSLPYSAPERIDPGLPPSELADVYSLGVVLHELLSLRLPYRADSEAGLIRLIVKGKPPALKASKLLGVRAVMAQATERAMRRDPARRPPSAAAFAYDLSRVLAGQSPTTRGDGLWAALRSRWRANPFVTAGSLLVALLLILLPTVVLSMQANAAERVASSAEISLRRLGLALEATASLKSALPESPIIAGTPLGALRANVLGELAEIESRVRAESPEGGLPGWPSQGAVASVKDWAPDRRWIQDVDTIVQGGVNESNRVDAWRLVKAAPSVQEKTTRSLDVDAALVELLQVLAIESQGRGTFEEAETWRTQALELCAELRQALPQSAWLKDRKVQLTQLFMEDPK